MRGRGGHGRSRGGRRGRPRAADALRRIEELADAEPTPRMSREEARQRGTEGCSQKCCEPARSRVRGADCRVATDGLRASIEARPAGRNRANAHGEGGVRKVTGAVACVRVLRLSTATTTRPSRYLAFHRVLGLLRLGTRLGCARRGGMASDRRTHRERQRHRLAALNGYPRHACISARVLAVWRNPPATLAARVAGLARRRRERTWLFGCGLFEPPFAAATALNGSFARAIGPAGLVGVGRRGSSQRCQAKATAHCTGGSHRIVR